MNRLRKHSSVLRVLKTAKPSIVRRIIKNGSNDLLCVLCECFHNVIKGYIPLTHFQKKRLQRHKNTLRTLANKKKLTLSKKKTTVTKRRFSRCFTWTCYKTLRKPIEPVMAKK